ncbi:MAG: hypothetical protein JNK75_03675 [Betaproteobacteria bacterium]|nr:hypothetical protein [Betaproteobacteria bacterium]
MYLNDGNLTYTYDVGTNSVGRLVSVNGYSGNTSFQYDTYGRVTSKTTYIYGAPASFTTAYTYDSVGRTATITYPSGNVLGMTYSEGRVTNMTLTPSGGSASPLISDVRYFPFGGPESWLLGPNAVTSATYIREIDLNSRIERYSTPTGYRQLGFDDGGRITSMKNCSGSTTVPCPTPNLLWTNTYGYDTTGRLTAFTGSTSNGDAAANITQTQAFTYDSNGNRLTAAILNSPTSTYSYAGGSPNASPPVPPTSNRLTSVTGGLVLTNTYDNAGNLTNDGTRTFVYDSRGRMTSATTAGTTTSYLIDYRNLRVKKSNATETKYFVYDDAGHMLGEYDHNGIPIQEIFWLNNTPIAIRGNMPCLTGGSCTETATAHVWTDHLNTPRELTRINGSSQHLSLWKWDSLPFGETTPNQNPSNLGTMNFNHRFPGQYRDSETGLYQNWHREYDARLGRYVTSDPIGLSGGLNSYIYAKASPLRLVDMNGLSPCKTGLDGALSLFKDAAGAVAHALAVFGICGADAKKRAEAAEKAANDAIKLYLNDPKFRERVHSALADFAARNPDYVAGRVAAGTLVSSLTGPTFGVPYGLLALAGGIMAASYTAVDATMSPDKLMDVIKGVLASDC